MCATLVVVGLIVAAVLLVPALARLVGAVVLILLMVAVARGDVLQDIIDAAPAITSQSVAEELRRYPLPVPQYGAGCPYGYSASTSGVCTPLATTRCRAFLSTGSCPTGWSYSPTSRMCVETAC